MRILCYYQEAIIPEGMEEITAGTEFLEGLIPFRAEQISQDKKFIERVAGLKEEDIGIVLRVNNTTFDNRASIKFKPRDKVLVYGNEYRIKAVSEKIPDKFQLRASRSKALYERYVEYTLMLGV